MIAPPEEERFMNKRVGMTRRVIHLAVEFESLTMLRPTQGGGYTYDLSPRGCRIESDITVERETYLAAKIELEDDTGSPIIVPVARVRWVTDRAFGIEFIKVWYRDSVRLEQYLWARRASGQE
jgi:hypothetical protein